MGQGPQGAPAQGATLVDIASDAAVLGVYAFAGALVLLGLWLLWGGRADEAISKRTAGRVRMKWWLGRIGRGLVSWGEGLTTPTRLTFAMSSLMLGYHLAAWTAPAHVLPFRIPLDLWFLLVGAIVVGCAMSVWLDRRQAADGHGGARAD